MTNMNSDQISIFNKKNNNNITLSTDINAEPNNSSLGSIFGKIKGYMSLSENDPESQVQEEKGFFGRMSDSVKSSVEVEKSYKLFFLFLSVGIGLLFFSLFFLPFVIFSPSKFVSLFSLGSIVTLSSFIFLYGTTGFIGMLLNGNRKFFTLLFISSLVLGLYFAIFQVNYIVSLILAVIQLITLIVFILSFIPGGHTGINFIGGMLLSPLYSLWGRFRGA
jgi:hypothetical protein